MLNVEVKVKSYQYSYDNFNLEVFFDNENVTIKSITGEYSIHTQKIKKNYLVAISKIFERIAEDLEQRKTIGEIKI